MDTMTATKIVGGVCGSLLVFLLVKWGADAIYEGGHGAEEMEAAYVIEVEGEGDTATAEAEEVVGPTFAELLASADVAKGEKTFGKCKACHKVEDGKNATGPYLFAVVDRPMASVEGFKYSDALLALGGTWTPEELNAFIESPKSYAPGTKMSFKGISKPADRANLIAYLATLGG